MENWHIELYSDGSAEPNPGKGGYGVILRHKDLEKQYFEGFTCTTNNRMEQLGVIVGLEQLKFPSIVDVYTDSSYVVNAITKGWVYTWKARNWRKPDGKPVINADLWQRLLSLLETHKVTFHWIKGHAGHPENERCDELARMARAAGRELHIDYGYVPETTLQTKLNFTSQQSDFVPNPYAKIKKEGDLCRKCGTPVVKQTPKKRDPKSSYYYEYYFLCPTCKTLFFTESAKHFHK